MSLILMKPNDVIGDAIFLNSSSIATLLWTSDGLAHLWKFNSSTYVYSSRDFPVEVVREPVDTVTKINFGQQIPEIDFDMYKVEIPYIILRKAGTGGGTVTANGLRCGNNCVELIIPYDKKAIETIRIVPNAGSYFVGWETSTGITLEDIQNMQPGEVVFAVFDIK